MSAKEGDGVQDILDAVINLIPPPNDNSQNPTRALIFDSMYDNYRGAIPYVRVFDGVIKAGMTAQFFAHGQSYEITEVGHFILKHVPTKELRAGDVGYIVA